MDSEKGFRNEQARVAGASNSSATAVGESTNSRKVARLLPSQLASAYNEGPDFFTNLATRVPSI